MSAFFLASAACLALVSAAFLAFNWAASAKPFFLLTSAALTSAAFLALASAATLALFFLSAILLSSSWLVFVSPMLSKPESIFILSFDSL